MRLLDPHAGRMVAFAAWLNSRASYAQEHVEAHLDKAGLLDDRTIDRLEPVTRMGRSTSLIRCWLTDGSELYLDSYDGSVRSYD